LWSREENRKPLPKPPTPWSLAREPLDEDHIWEEPWALGSGGTGATGLLVWYLLRRKSSKPAEPDG